MNNYKLENPVGTEKKILTDSKLLCHCRVNSETQMLGRLSSPPKKKKKFLLRFLLEIEITSTFKAPFILFLSMKCI